MRDCTNESWHRHWWSPLMVATDGLYNAIVYSQPRCRVECGWSLLSRQAPSYRMNKGEMKRAKTRRDKKKNICMHWEKPACPCVCASVCVYARAEQSCQQQSNKWMNADNVSIAGCIQLNEDILVSRLQFFVVCFSFFFISFVGFGTMHEESQWSSSHIRMSVVVSVRRCLFFFRMQSLFAGNISRTQHKCAPRA